MEHSRTFSQGALSTVKEASVCILFLFCLANSVAQEIINIPDGLVSHVALHFRGGILFEGLGAYQTGRADK